MNRVMQEALVCIAYACVRGTANRQSAYALNIIGGALLGDPELVVQRLVILAVAETLELDGQPAEGDGERLLQAARRIALVAEQRSEDQHIWGETKCS